MNKRIKAVRKAKDLTQTKFGERIGANRNQIAFAEGEGNNVSPVLVTAICQEYNVSESWLRTGEGEMFNPPKADEDDLEVARRVLKAKIRALPPEAQRLILDLCLEIQQAASEYPSAPPSAPPAKKNGGP